MILKPKGDKKLIVISAPSGAGKTTLANFIVSKYPKFKFSVSATTRLPRPNEVNGKDYYFLSKEEFEKLIYEGRLVEYEQLFGHYYGTLMSEVDNSLQKGQIVVFDIDVKGALSIRNMYPNESILIFIAPPTMEALIERLRNRATENSEQLAQRIERAKMEMSLMKEFDFIIVNDDLEKAKREIDNIVQSFVSVL